MSEFLQARIEHMDRTGRLAEKQIKAIQGIQIKNPGPFGAGIYYVHHRGKKTKNINLDTQILLWEQKQLNGYTPLRAMREGLEDKDPPLNVQVAHCDSKLVKRIYMNAEKKFNGDFLTLWQQEFVRLCKEDGLL